MGRLLTTASSLMCPHGGQVSISSANTRSKADGAILVRSSDIFTISGCPLNISGAPHPCIKVDWQVTAQNSKSSGALHLTEESVGFCVAGDQTPQGPAQVLNTQVKVSGR